MKNILKWLVAVVLSLFVSFSAGAATVTVAGSGINQNIAVGVPNQFLGQFTVTTTGEPVSFPWITFKINSTNLFTNVTLVDQNGAVVAGPIDSMALTNLEPLSLLDFNDVITFPIGQRTYVIKGNLSSSFTNNETFFLYTEPHLSWHLGSGQITGNYVQADPHNTVMSVTVTAKRADLKVSVDSNFPSGTIVPGTVGATFARYTLDATQSSEDIRMSSLPITLPDSYYEGNGLKLSDLSSCQLFDGGIALNTTAVLNPIQFGIQTITFDSAFVVPKGTIKTLTLKGNVALSASAGSFSWGLPFGGYVATGVTSGTTVNVRIGTTNGSSIWILGFPSGASLKLTLNKRIDPECNCEALLLSGEVAIGYLYKVQSTTNLTPPIQWTEEFGPVVADSTNMSWAIPLSRVGNKFFRLVEMPPSRLVVSTDASSPAYQVVAGGQVGVVTTVAKFRAPYEPVNLTRIALQLSSGSPRDVVQATIWDGTTQVGQTQFIGTNTQSVVILSSPVLVPKDTDKLLTIKVDLANIGVAEPVTNSGHFVDIYTGEGEASKGFPPADVVGVGVISGETIKATGIAWSSGVRVFKSYPTFAIDSLPSTGVADGRLMRFKVTASPSGPVSLHKIAIWINPMVGGVGAIDSMNLYGYADSSYSIPISGVSAGGAVSATNFNNSATPLLSVYAQTSNGSLTSVVISAGQTYYFEVRGTVSADLYAVGSALVGDGSDGLDFALDTPVSLESLHFRAVIWSPNSRTMSALTDQDWTDGRSIPTLPSQGMVRYR